MIEILNTYSGDVVRYVFVALTLACVAVLNFYLLWNICEVEPGYAITAMFNLIVIGVLFLSALITGIQESNKEYYEATIDPEVPFVEVMERYEIDDRRGDIWILTEPKKETGV